MGWILQLHPLCPWMGEVLKTSERACTVRAYLGWKHHEVPWGEYYNSTPSPHGWERYLRQVRGPAQWELTLVGSTMKYHGGEYYNSTPSPHGWERYLKQARGPAQWELILVGSTIEWILQLHPPPYCPSLHGMLVHHSIAHQYVAINFNTKLKICACVCVLGGGGEAI